MHTITDQDTNFLAPSADLDGHPSAVAGALGYTVADSAESTAAASDDLRVEYLHLNSIDNSTANRLLAPAGWRYERSLAEDGTVGTLVELSSGDLVRVGKYSYALVRCRDGQTDGADLRLCKSSQHLLSLFPEAVRYQG